MAHEGTCRFTMAQYWKIACENIRAIYKIPRIFSGVFAKARKFQQQKWTCIYRQVLKNKKKRINFLSEI